MALVTEPTAPGPVTLTRKEKALAAEIGAQVAAAIVVAPVEPEPVSDTEREGLAPPMVVDQLFYGAQPLAGADFSYQVPGDRALWPLSVMCRLTTSNAAGARYLTLEYHDSNNVRYLVAGAPVTLAASQQQSFCWQPDAGTYAWPVSDVAIAALPQQLIPPSRYVVLNITGGAVGDQLDQVVISARWYSTFYDLPTL